MGWLQYSRPLWLSIGNPYILYLKAITGWMPIYGSLFSTASRVRLYCMDLALLFRLKSVGLLVRGRGVRGPRELCHGRDGRPAFNMVTCISTDYAVAAEGGEMRRLVAGSATAGIRGEGQLSSAGPMAT
jgi:hypothetical protein